MLKQDFICLINKLNVQKGRSSLTVEKVYFLLNIENILGIQKVAAINFYQKIYSKY